MLEFLKKIWMFFITPMSKAEEIAPTKENQQQIIVDVKSQATNVVTPLLVRQTFVKHMRSFEGERETNGANRSKFIDMINKWIGVGLGSPYCATSVSYALKKTEDELKVKIKLPKTASSQSMFNKADAKYKSKTPDYGFIGVMQNKSDKNYGHVVVALSKLDSKGNFQTTECNTDALGSRDGQGCMLSQRNIKGDTRKIFIGFLDVGAAAEIADVKPPTPQRIALSWEVGKPERKNWSDFITKFVSNNLEVFSSAKDITQFNPNFHNLTKENKIKTISEIVVAVAYYESGHNPKSRMIETTMGKDPVTGRQVASEGLLQLSYQDVKNYGALLKDCGIDWSKDKNLKDTDANKTIFNPIYNLDAGLRILKRQIENKKSITLSSGVYWAVLKIGGKYTKITEIIGRVKRNT